MTDPALPPLPSLATISARLPLIFPEGTDNRGYLIRELAAKTIFVLLYLGAIEGERRWARPNQVTRMTDEQSMKTADEDRRTWQAHSMSSKARSIPGRWYATDTREPIRDETIRESLVPLGAVIERPGLEKTSSKPRWALAADFARLFVPTEEELPTLLAEWQRAHLSAAARARLALVRRGVAGADQHGVLVTFPNRQTRVLSPGESSVIAKGVIEEFGPRFLHSPGVLWVSETSRKDEAADQELARMVHLNISANELLPDIILVDLGYDAPRFVFVEVVASDGPMTSRRREDLLRLVEQGGHDPRNAAFGTAFLDRGKSVYRRVASRLAWESFTWFVSEPERLIIHRDLATSPQRLFNLFARTREDG